MNPIGLYRGGVPQKGRGAIRGTAIGKPGEFHSPKTHNFLNFYHPDAKIINSEDAAKFKAFMVSDKDDFNLTRPSHPMYYDREMLFMKDRSFWLGLIVLMMLGLYGSNRYEVEKARM